MTSISLSDRSTDYLEKDNSKLLRVQFACFMSKYDKGTNKWPKIKGNSTIFHYISDDEKKKTKTLNIILILLALCRQQHL